MSSTSKVRTTISEYFAAGETHEGLYVIACYPSIGCLYIGRSNDVQRRMREHVSDDSPLCNLLKDLYADSGAWRLDILLPPAGVDVREWCIEYERKLIQYFRPVFNEQGINA